MLPILFARGYFHWRLGSWRPVAWAPGNGTCHGAIFTGARDPGALLHGRQGTGRAMEPCWVPCNETFCGFLPGSRGVGVLFLFLFFDLLILTYFLPSFLPSFFDIYIYIYIGTGTGRGLAWCHAWSLCHGLPGQVVCSPL